MPLQDGRVTYEARVSFEDALETPVHRWYFYKEGYSPRLLKLILDEVTPPSDGWLLDSCGGVGTTVLSALELEHFPFVGALSVEYNPFSHFVAATKIASRALDAATLRRLARGLTRHKPKAIPPIPDSATLRNLAIYPRHRLLELRRLLGRVNEIASDPYRNLLRLALASVLEPASFARKDGRALRILPATTKLKTVEALFAQAVQNIAADLEASAANAGSKPRGKRQVRMHNGDARTLPAWIKPERVSMAVYSPPYLNGIDYSEVYKVEEYFLGFVDSNASLKRIREGTLRSHASIRFADRELALEHLPLGTARDLLTAISAFVKAEERRPFQSQYAWLIPSYFEDMYKVLKEQTRVLKPGGYSVCVVANSMLGNTIETKSRIGDDREELWRIPIPTDAIIAALGRHLGLTTVKAIWARSLRPRNVRTAWSRETIVVMRKD
jgi:hypothetical protein